MVQKLKELREQLFDAPIEVKESFNNLVNYFENKTELFSISEEELQVVSLRNLLNVPEAVEILSSYPKLGRIVTVLLEASKGTLPFVYLVNYKFSETLLRRINSAGPDYYVTTSDVFGSDQSTKMHDALLSTQGIFVKSYHKDDFNPSILSDYGIPNLNGVRAYLDINKLTSKSKGPGSDGKVEIKYSTTISYHISEKAVSKNTKDMEVHLNKVKVSLPESINLKRFK